MGVSVGRMPMTGQKRTAVAGIVRVACKKLLRAMYSVKQRATGRS